MIPNPDRTDFATAWIEERPGLRLKTVTLYRYMLRRHIAPCFPAKTVGEIKEGQVRRWRRKLLDSGVSEVTTANAYRLLQAILNTAVDDGMIRRNLCRVKGASVEKSSERPVLTVPEVFTLAKEIDQRYAALILLAAFGSLRWGELAALRRKDIDQDVTTVRIDGLPLRHTNFRRRFWLPVLTAAGLPPTRFHGLRHTGNAFTADAGANLRELMERMGHSTTKAALTYLHSTGDRQQAIADAISKRAKADLRKAKAKASGTGVARRNKANPSDPGK